MGIGCLVEKRIKWRNTGKKECGGARMRLFRWICEVSEGDCWWWLCRRSLETWWTGKQESSVWVVRLRDGRPERPLKYGLGYLPWLTSCLLLHLKPWEVRWATRQPAFMSDCRTITHTFYSPIYPLDEGNEDVGLIYFDVNKASSLGQKTKTWVENMTCIVSAAVTKLGEIKGGCGSWIGY